MSSKQPDIKPGGVSLGDIYFTLFRHKWKILSFSAAGILAALVLLLLKPPLYESKAKLDILYVVQGKSLNPAGEDANTVSPGDRGYGIIQTEKEILQSLEFTKGKLQKLFMNLSSFNHSLYC